MRTFILCAFFLVGAVANVFSDESAPFFNGVTKTPPASNDGSRQPRSSLDDVPGNVADNELNQKKTLPNETSFSTDFGSPASLPGNRIRPVSGEQTVLTTSPPPFSENSSIPDVPRNVDNSMSQNLAEETQLSSEKEPPVREKLAKNSGQPKAGTPLPKNQDSFSTPPQSQGALKMVFSLVMSLTFVLAILFGVMFFLKRFSSGALPELSDHVLKKVGQFSLTPKTRLYLLQFGPRLLLVAVTDNQATTLAELTDPGEMAQILQKCPEKPESSSDSFWQIVGKTFREGKSMASFKRSPETQRGGTRR